MALLVYHVLQGFSFLLFPPGSVNLLSFGIGIGVTLKSFFHFVLKGLGTTFLFGISNDLLWVGLNLPPTHEMHSNSLQGCPNQITHSGRFCLSKHTLNISNFFNVSVCEEATQSLATFQNFLRNDLPW